MLHTSRARTCLFTELEVNRVQAEPSVHYSTTRLQFTIWSQFQTFENRASDERRQKETGEEKKQGKALKHRVVIIKLTAAGTNSKSHRESDMFPK